MAVSLISVASCATSKKATKSEKLPALHITFTGEQVADTVFVTVTPIPTDTTLFLKEYIESRDTGPTKAYAVKDRSVHIFPESVPSIYRIYCDYYALPSYYMRSSDHLEMTINSLGPARYKVTGGIYSNEIPFAEEFYKLRSKLYRISRDKLTEHELDSLSAEMNSLIDRIMAVSDPETATHVVTFLEEDFVQYAFDRLPAGSDKTLFYTYACAERNSAARADQQQKMLEEAVETSAPVPQVSLSSLDGKTFDLSSLHGKWVVLDFWSTGCAPCIRGFEKMKKVYDENSDKLEIVGIACGDQLSTWKTAVEKLELPWINLLAPDPLATDGTVAGFPITAYPTKILVDPEGKLCEYITGETDEFYTTLAKRLNK